MPTPEAMARNRWLRWLGPSLLHPRLWHLSRRGVATGAAIGVFFAFITPIAQIPLSAALSVLLRANVPAAVVATLVNTPPTFGPVYYAAWWVGARVLDEPVDAEHKPGVLAGQPSTLQAAGPALSGWSKWIVTLVRLFAAGLPAGQRRVAPARALEEATAPAAARPALSRGASAARLLATRRIAKNPECRLRPSRAGNRMRFPQTRPHAEEPFP